jgi:hypothetical protein
VLLSSGLPPAFSSTETPGAGRRPVLTAWVSVIRQAGAATSKRHGRAGLRGWLALFIVLPLGVWLAASLRSGFHEKSLSNVSLEPLVVLLFSIAVFVMWFLVARRGLRPVAGIILLILLLAAALAVQRFLPHLSE